MYSQIMKLGNNIKLLKQKCTRATANYRSSANTRNTKAMKPFPHWIPAASLRKFTLNLQPETTHPLGQIPQTRQPHFHWTTSF